MSGLLLALILIVVGYISGALPFGVWVAAARGIDIRKMGSGSTGATNVYRCVGKKEGILVMILDMLKGYLPVTAAIFLDHGNMTASLPMGAATVQIGDLVPCFVGAMCMIGHSKSCFLGFTGGKSAATGLGTITALNPAVGGLVFIVFLSTIYLTKIVSVASMTAGIVDVIFMALFKAPPAFIGYAAFGGLLVIIRHKANIQRLMNGTEPRIGEKAKAPKPEEESQPKPIDIPSDQVKTDESNS
ncbi:MAG: glycerol-3-phosphate 1-O-acyltransferase PlsY [Cyanobacteria bacterium SZAS LIN-2]|nr:glycerol-3-phosphate 1-O-acyltransferase PlsY [Cyanobacteria bacterium SZAS LIN-3]MBS1995066.1 glycerol-3-phosphate 1-O-acyltransferase PlsY [Cyanobacteria bacterium SZAS LIN-2]